MGLFSPSPNPNPNQAKPLLQRLPTTADDAGRDATIQALTQAVLGQPGSKGRSRTKADALLMEERAQP